MKKCINIRINSIQITIRKSKIDFDKEKPIFIYEVSKLTFLRKALYNIMSIITLIVVFGSAILYSHFFGRSLFIEIATFITVGIFMLIFAKYMDKRKEITKEEILKMLEEEL